MVTKRDGQFLYFVNAKKQQRPEVAEKYPNLAKSPVWVEIKKWKNHRNPLEMESEDDETIKEELEEALKEKMRHNPKFQWEDDEEYVKVVPAWTTEDEYDIYEGEIAVPDEEEQQEENDNTEDDVSKSDNSLGGSEALM